MGDIALRVNGLQLAGWTRATVTRGIEAVAGSFELSVSDKWANVNAAWPVVEEDECSVLVGGVPVLTGYVDRRSPAFGPTEHSLTVSGRDKTGDLVDCSAILSKWEFTNIPVLTLARRVAEPFGIPVSLQPGLAPPRPAERLTVDPGDSAFDVIERACRLVGLLPVSDGVGGLVLTRAGTSRATTELVEGVNILSASATFDVSGRFRRYVVLGQHRGADDFFGESAGRIRASATDLSVEREARVLVVRPEGNVTTEIAKRRAEWEATVRASRGDTVAVTVQGWTQADGNLWPVNAIVRVRAPHVGVDADMLIAQAVYSASADGGTTTQLALKRPDAFKPEPVKAKASGLWKEIARGV